MDNKLVFGLTYATALGSGLMAGLFFTFSVFMMRSLDRLPPSQGIAAMQSINTTIVTPLFLLVFVGTTVACAVLGGVAAFAVDGPARVWLIVGCLLYLVGCFLLTGAFHIPRNDKLDGFDPTTAEAARYWATYVREWTLGNHVRTLSCIGALGSLVMAIRVG